MDTMDKASEELQNKMMDAMKEFYSVQRSEQIKRGIEAKKERVDKPILAFGKRVARDEAYQIIINDKICDICHAGNTDSLEDLLVIGWKSLLDWSNDDLEECIDGLCLVNQPKEVICKFS